MPISVQARLSFHWSYQSPYNRSPSHRADHSERQYVPAGFELQSHVVSFISSFSASGPACFPHRLRPLIVYFAGFLQRRVSPRSRAAWDMQVLSHCAGLTGKTACFMGLSFQSRRTVGPLILRFHLLPITPPPCQERPSTWRGCGRWRRLSRHHGPFLLFRIWCVSMIHVCLPHIRQE